MPEPLLYVQATGTAVIISVVLVLALAMVRRLSSSTWLNFATLLGSGLGLAVGYHLLGALGWPPTNGLERLLAIVLPAVLGIELVAGSSRLPRWGAWLMRSSCAAAIPPVLLYGSVYLSGTDGPWPSSQLALMLCITAALLAGVWALLAWLSARSPGVSLPIALALAIQTAGLTVMLAGYLKGGAAAMPLAGTLIATTLAASWVQRRRPSLGAADPRAAVSANTDDLNRRAAATASQPCLPPVILAMGVVGLFGLLFVGRYFGRLGPEAAVVILLSPLLCWVTEIPGLRHRSPWLLGSIRVLAVAIPLVVVLVLAKRAFDRDLAPLLG